MSYECLLDYKQKAKTLNLVSQYLENFVNLLQLSANKLTLLSTKSCREVLNLASHAVQECSEIKVNTHLLYEIHFVFARFSNKLIFVFVLSATTNFEEE